MLTFADPTLSGRSNPKFFPVRVTRMPPVVGKRPEAEVMVEMLGRVYPKGAALEVKVPPLMASVYPLAPGPLPMPLGGVNAQQEKVPGVVDRSVLV